ncbi:biliverdin-producing heme oxygenase [Paraburkholderia bannensis]|uniref:biliverdin-producing heme oxygenase n=1 Tax=Paraburkholderia bannensis TaxID=765414 RepID=UPI002ABDF30F|nr:biliverdin-producing heme oxygenase [Paraburkholderia bannensis]
MTALRSAAESSFVDVLGALRLATASRHESAERAMPLAVATPTLVNYQQHLQVLHAWLAPLDAWLQRFDDGPQDPALLPPLARLALIERDLAHPALQGTKGSLGSTPPVAASQPLAALEAGAAWRWGACYVIEGSQLGGAVLLRRYAGTFAPHPLDYLSGDGNAPGPRWHAFVAAMRRAVHTPRDVDLACAGARAAFDRLIALLPDVAADHASAASRAVTA